MSLLRGPFRASSRFQARCVQEQPVWLGAYYRRMCARLDKAKALIAAAHKFARLIYFMLTKAEEYTDQGRDSFIVSVSSGSCRNGLKSSARALRQ